MLPIFMMLLLGMFTGGLAYSRKLSVAQAAREGARYGATLPIPADVDVWLGQVAALVIASGDGELTADRPGQRVCISYVTGSGVVRSRRQTGAGVVFTASPCIAGDGRSEARVQVVAGRTSTFEALVFSRDLDLVSEAVARHELP